MQGCSSWGDKTRCDPVHYSNLYLLGRHFKSSGWMMELSLILDESSAIILPEIPLVAWYYPDTKKSASHIYHSNFMEKWTSKDRWTKQICLVKIQTYRARIMEYFKDKRCYDLKIPEIGRVTSFWHHLCQKLFGGRAGNGSMVYYWRIIQKPQKEAV